MSQSAITSSPAPVTGVGEAAGHQAADIQSAESLGVVRHMTETYSVGSFRYTSLTDAVAQARRMIRLERELI